MRQGHGRPPPKARLSPPGAAFRHNADYSVSCPIGSLTWPRGLGFAVPIASRSGAQARTWDGSRLAKPSLAD